MHEPVAYENLWFFIIGGIILCGLLFFLSPKLINLLDRWIDGKYQEEKKSFDKNENKTKHQ